MCLFNRNMCICNNVIHENVINTHQISQDICTLIILFTKDIRKWLINYQLLIIANYDREGWTWCVPSHLVSTKMNCSMLETCSNAYCFFFVCFKVTNDSKSKISQKLSQRNCNDINCNVSFSNRLFKYTNWNLPTCMWLYTCLTICSVS